MSTRLEPSRVSSREALRDRIRRTLRLLHTNIAHVRDAPAGDTRAEKAACEIALFCWALQRNGHVEETDSACVAGLVDAIEPRLRSDSIVAGLIWKPKFVSMLSMGTTFLRELGRPDAAFDAAARVAWSAPRLHAAERMPFQELEAHWSARIFGVGADRAIPPSCLLLRKPFPPMMTAEDAYAYTHAVFYATDFGREALPESVTLCDAWDVLDSGILHHLANFDFDLVAEFLVSALYCRMPQSAAFRVGLCSLLLTWDENGFVPDRALDPRQGEARELFFGIYHANAVGALLCSELLARDFTLAEPAPPDTAAPIRLALPLEALLGSEVAQGLLEQVGIAALATVQSELIAYVGFATRDMAKVRAALGRGDDSWALRCAAGWLAMAEQIARLKPAAKLHGEAGHHLPVGSGA